MQNLSTDGIDICDWETHVDFERVEKEKKAEKLQKEREQTASEYQKALEETDYKKRMILGFGKMKQGLGKMRENVGEFTSKLDKGTLVNFSVWDFAGQDLYYASHQFFLTSRSIFILVFNLVLGEENSKVRYWLESLKCRAPDAPIIVSPLMMSISLFPKLISISLYPYLVGRNTFGRSE